MPLRIKCPTGHTLIVPEDRAGRTLRCPRCEQPVVVPGKTVVGRRPADDAARQGEPATAGVERQGTQPAKEPPLPSTAIPPAEPSAAESVDLPPAPTVPAEVPLPPVVTAPPVVTTPPVVTAPPVITAPPVVTTTPVVTSPPVATSPPIVASPPEVTGPAVEPPPVQVVVSEPATEDPVSTPTQSRGHDTQPEPELEPTATEQQESAAFAEVAAPEDPEPPAPPIAVPQPVGKPALPGVIPDRSRVLTVYQLAAAVVVAALFSIAPAIWDIAEYLRIPDSHFVARWALALLFLGVVQVAYAVYVVQLPDWGSVWVVTLYSLALAALYAMVLGLTLISPADGSIVGFLQLGDKIDNHKAPLWCLCMVSVATLLAFFAGRLSVRWHKAEQVLRSVRG